MIREIVKDTNILQQSSDRAIYTEDQQVIRDLLDTAMAHFDNCLGLAAIQIGEPKRIVVIRNGKGFMPMINPQITWKSRETSTRQEGCLSLDGLRTVERPIAIKVMFQDKIGGRFKSIRVRDTNADNEIPFARVIQHEIDHTKGVLV